jgi:hypothetical protein
MKEVVFRWRYVGLPKVVARYTGQGQRPHESNAVLRLDDDGWHVEQLMLRKMLGSRLPEFRLAVWSPTRSPSSKKVGTPWPLVRRVADWVQLYFGAADEGGGSFPCDSTIRRATWFTTVALLRIASR